MCVYTLLRCEAGLQILKGGVHLHTGADLNNTPSLRAPLTHSRVMAARCAASCVGRYMMTPTQLNTLSCGPCAGLSGDALPLVQRCSMGQGAATPARASSRSSSCATASKACVHTDVGAPKPAEPQSARHYAFAMTMAVRCEASIQPH